MSEYLCWIFCAENGNGVCWIIMYQKHTNKLKTVTAMKTKHFLAFVLLCLTMSASAQVQLLFIEGGGRNVIDRNKKLYWMEGDDDPCFDILNYKKVGNKETFDLKSKEDATDKYSAVIILNAKTQEPEELTLTHKTYGKQGGKVKTTSGSKSEDTRLKEYFNGLAGNPTSPNATAGVSSPIPSSVSDAKSDDNSDDKSDVKSEESEKGTVDKVKDAAKGTLGKVKGVFKKKK